MYSSVFEANCFKIETFEMHLQLAYLFSFSLIRLSPLLKGTKEMKHELNVGRQKSLFVNRSLAEHLFVENRCEPAPDNGFEDEIDLLGLKKARGVRRQLRARTLFVTEPAKTPQVVVMRVRRFEPLTRLADLQRFCGRIQ
jgi:hypothetical protein